MPTVAVKPAGRWSLLFHKLGSNTKTPSPGNASQPPKFSLTTLPPTSLVKMTHKYVTEPPPLVSPQIEY